jgi:hypothetical protein
MLGKFEVFYVPGKSGYIDASGKIVIADGFQPFMSRSFSGGLAAVSDVIATPDKARWGFIDKKGKVVAAQNYSRAEDVSDSLAAIAAPMTPRQFQRFEMYLQSRSSYYLARPLDWNHAPDDGWWSHEHAWYGRSRDRYFGPWGFIDKKGTLAIPLRFSSVRSFRDGLAYAVRGNLSGFIDKSGKWTITNGEGGEFTGDFSEGLARVRKSEKEGCIDKKGNLVIAPRFYRLFDFSNGRAAFMTEDGDYGFIDKTGKIVIEAKYDQVRSFSDGLASVQKGSFWGWVDVSGRVVIPLKYKYIMSFSCGLAAVSIDGKWGYIDTKGKIAIAPQFNGASVFRNNRARVNIGGNYYKTFSDSEIGSYGTYSITNGAWRYIDKSGEFISDLKFDNALDFRDGLAAFKMFSKCGLKDANGRIVIPAQLDGIDNRFVGGMAKVISRGRWGFVNESGKLTVPPVFAKVGDFAKGPASVKAGTLWGYVNRDGTFAVKPQFPDALGFSEQLAAVQFPPADKRKDAKWGYIDTSGKVVLKQGFEAARSFSESLAAARLGGRFGYIDKSAQMVIQPQFQGARDFDRGLAVVCRMNLDGLDDALWGVIDKKSNYVIPAVFPREPKIENGIYVFESRDRGTGRVTKCLVDRKGIVRDSGKSLGTVAEHFLPGLLETVAKNRLQQARSALCALSAIGGPKALKALRDSIKTPDVYTCRLAAAALGRATGQDALDILLKQLGGDEAKFADWASEAVMQMISEPKAAMAFLKRQSTVPEKYRLELMRRAVMAIAVGPRVPKSWRSDASRLTFTDMEISQVFQFMRDVTDSSIVVDWRGLAELSFVPATTINVQLPRTAMARVWDEILDDLGDSRVDCIVVNGTTVVTTRDRLGLITSAISAQPPIGRKKPAENKAVVKLLQTRVSKLNFGGMQLSQVQEFLYDVSGAKIEIDWEALAPLGVRPETPINVHLGKTTFDIALRLILVDAAGPGKLTYKVDDGKIHIIRALKAAAPPTRDPVTVLAGALKHADRKLRLRAVEALGNIGPAAKTALPALTKMLKDQDKQIRDAAAEAIKRISQTPATKPKP